MGKFGKKIFKIKLKIAFFSKNGLSRLFFKILICL